MTERFSRFIVPSLAAAVAAAWATTALALVDPSLQPFHIVERYKSVVGGRIAEADYDSGRVVIDVTSVIQGTFAPKRVTVEVPEVGFDEPSFFDDAVRGGTVVAFIGRKLRRHENELLVYAGQQWHGGETADPSRPDAWTWTEAFGDEMVGTFNGAAQQLLALVEDIAEGRAYFPPRPCVKFREAKELARFSEPIPGVALYDVDGDGRLDVYACSTEGDRLLIQDASGGFADRAEALGLAGVKGPSVSFADVDADGRADLLAGATLWLGGEKGFRRTDLLPAEAAKDLRCAAFVELNGDGRPDVVVSRTGGGLALYLNRGGGSAEVGFTDATAALGLARQECGAAGTGYFAPGDWNRDGRTDLYYGAGKGYLLVQTEAGVLAPVPHHLPFEFASPGDDEVTSGAGGFSPQWKPDRWDLVSAAPMHLVVATNDGGEPRNVTGFSNELRLCRPAQVGSLAADLNVDGHVDLFTFSRKANVANSFHTNRGYGSYMLPELYPEPGYDAFPPKAYETGATSAAAGDTDGDGALDLLLGGADGVLRLLTNDAFSLRKPREHPTYHQKKREQARILTVRVRGPVGVLGAEVAAADSKGRTVAMHRIGGQVLTGCRGPDTADLAIREPGRYALSVRFSDGRLWKRDVDLTGPKHVVVTAARPAASEAAE